MTRSRSFDWEAISPAPDAATPRPRLTRRWTRPSLYGERNLAGSRLISKPNFRHSAKYLAHLWFDAYSPDKLDHPFDPGKIAMSGSRRTLWLPQDPSPSSAWPAPISTKRALIRSSSRSRSATMARYRVKPIGTAVKREMGIVPADFNRQRFDRRRFRYRADWRRRGRSRRSNADAQSPTTKPARASTPRRRALRIAVAAAPWHDRCRRPIAPGSSVRSASEDRTGAGAEVEDAEQPSPAGRSRSTKASAA